MKKILLIGCLLCANLQAQFYNFESAATGSSGISTATARQNTGWTSNGTTAQDTLAIYYLINGKYHRLILVDTDNDSVIIAPHALFPLAGKDATSLLFAFDSTGRLGLNALTSAQARRAIFNVLGRAANDTLAIFSNDGGGVVGDSTVMIDHAGRIGIKTAPSASYSLTNLNGMFSGWYNASVGSGGTANTLVSLQNTGSGAGTGATINIDGTVIRGVERSSVVDLELVAGTNGRVSLIPGASGSIMIGQGAASTTSQAFVTIRTQTPTADTLFMARNDKDATLDSTMMVFANGSGYFGGNNLYIGGHRIRSNAAGDSLIFYDGNTMIFAILSDGSTADLVAGTPPFKFFGWHRDEIIFWILTIAGLLIWIVAILAIYDKVKEIRIREHKTLPGEI